MKRKLQLPFNGKSKSTAIVHDHNNSKAFLFIQVIQLNRKPPTAGYLLVTAKKITKGGFVLRDTEKYGFVEL